MPEISVIVPVYNVEKYLHRCVDSILAQTFTDFELILVDDGSPDRCGAICDEYAAKDHRVRVIHKENGGVSRARNAALDVAQGTYIAFCDSDDYWHIDYLKTAIEAMEATSADMVVMNYAALSEAGKLVRKTQHSTGIIDYARMDAKYNYLVDCLLNCIHGWEIWTRLFKNSIIQNNHIRFCTESGNYGEDMGFVLEYMLCSQSVSSIPESYYCYTLRAGSMMDTSRKTVKLDQMNEVSHYVYQRYKPIFENTEYRTRFPILHFLILRIELNKIIGTDRYCELSKEFKKIRNIQWCRRELRKLYACSSFAAKYSGRRLAGQMLLLTHYCLHGNWRRFCWESAIAYKWLIPKE